MPLNGTLMVDVSAVNGALGAGRDGYARNSDEFAGAAGLAWPDDGGTTRTVVGADMVANGTVRTGGAERIGGAKRSVRGVGGAERLALGVGGAERVMGLRAVDGVGGAERVVLGVGARR